MSDSMTPPPPFEPDCCSSSSCDSLSCSRSSFSAIGFCAGSDLGAITRPSLRHSADGRLRLSLDHTLPDLPRDVAENGVAPVQDPGLLRHLGAALLDRLRRLDGHDTRHVAHRLLPLDELPCRAPRDLRDQLRGDRRELVLARRRRTVRRLFCHFSPSSTRRPHVQRYPSKTRTTVTIRVQNGSIPHSVAQGSP